MKKRVLISFILLSVFPALVLLLTSCSGFRASDMKYVVHGGGILSGYNLYGEETEFTCSNSREGLQQCAESGCRFIETDFNFTSDGHLVCLHDWYHMYADEIETGTPLSLDEFLDVKIYRQYDSIWLGDIATFLRENKKTYIVTDIKDRNVEGLKAISEYCPDLMNRFIVQIYSEDEYSDVSSLGYKNILYTLYRLNWDEKHDFETIKDFVSKNKIDGIVFSYELCSEEGYIESMLKTGVPLFVHTVDNTSEMKELFDSGITGIYTNTLSH